MTATMPAYPILVVEDDEATGELEKRIDEELIRELISEILIPLGAKVYFAENGDEALGILAKRANEIDSIILDVGMPDVSGIDVYQKLRTLGSNVPVLFCTGYADAEKIQTVSLAEADFIEKPFEADELIQKIIRSLTCR